jgi:hypothetical protein
MKSTQFSRANRGNVLGKYAVAAVAAAIALNPPLFENTAEAAPAKAAKAPQKKPAKDKRPIQ